MVSGIFMRYCMTGRGSNGNHYNKGENAVLPDLKKSTCPGGFEVYMQPINTSVSGPATNSRLVGAATQGFNAGDMWGAFTYQHLGTSNDQIFQMHGGDTTTRVFDFVVSGNKLAFYDINSTATPNKVGSYTIPSGQWNLIEYHASVENSTMDIWIRDPATYVLRDTISATGTGILGDFEGGTAFGDCYVGRVLSRGGNTAGNFGDFRYGSTSGIMPIYQVHWQLPNKEMAVNGWTPNYTADFVTAVRAYDSKGATSTTPSSSGTFVRHAASAGTGIGYRLTYSLRNLVNDIPDNAEILGITTVLDGWSDIGGSAARFTLEYNYNGTTYSLASQQMNPPVSGDGGYPHTRTIGFYDRANGTYNGPDGSVWTRSKLENATIGCFPTNDSDAINVSALMVGIAYWIPNITYQSSPPPRTLFGRGGRTFVR